MLHITPGDKQHWNSISSTRPVQIISKYMERLQVLCAGDELCVPAVIGPNGMADGVDDIETMFV